MLLRIGDLRNYTTPDAADDDVPPDRPPLFHAVSAEGAGRVLVGRHGVDLLELIGELAPESTTWIPTAGQWSLHEMIDHLVRRLGPCHIWLTSWGITAEPLKAILRMEEEGRFLGPPTFLFDSRVRTQCPQAYQVALASKARIYYGKNHSKVVVMRNAQGAIAISTSANLTQNPRFENYVIDTHRSVANAMVEVIEQFIQRADPFEPL